MDPVKLVLGAYLILLMLASAVSVMQVGRPREPLSPEGVGCAVVINMVLFATILAVWNRI